jgi:Zn-dependent protease/CBS domain-containing protein
VGGVPIGVHWSLAVVFGLITWELADFVLPGIDGSAGRPAYWVAAVVAAMLFLVSLLAHEASHAVVARVNGVGVRSITLWLFGGVAQLEGEAASPGADFAIAAVGPGMSITLAGVFGAAQILLERAGVHGLAIDVSSWLWQINLLLAAFNLIPAAPLDGGRILRAGLWKKSKDRTRASVSAARAGLGFGVLLVAAGFVEFVVGSPIGLWPALLGWFLFSAARAEERAARHRQAVEGLPVGSVMWPHPPVVPSSMTVAELLSGPIHWWHGAQVAAVTGPSGWVDGVVTVDRIRRVPESAWHTTPLGAIAEGADVVPVVHPDDPMPLVLEQMYVADGRPAVVLDADGRVVGTVSIDDVARAGMTRRFPAPAWPAPGTPAPGAQGRPW